jgi:hypothetical protein
MDDDQIAESGSLTAVSQASLIGRTLSLEPADRSPCGLGLPGSWLLVTFGAVQAAWGWEKSNSPMAAPNTLGLGTPGVLGSICTGGASRRRRLRVVQVPARAGLLDLSIAAAEYGEGGSQDLQSRRSRGFSDIRRRGRDCQTGWLLHNKPAQGLRTTCHVANCGPFLISTSCRHTQFCYRVFNQRREIRCTLVIPPLKISAVWQALLHRRFSFPRYDIGKGASAVGPVAHGDPWGWGWLSLWSSFYLSVKSCYLPGSGTQKKIQSLKKAVHRSDLRTAVLTWANLVFSTCKIRCS